MNGFSDLMDRIRNHGADVISEELNDELVSYLSKSTLFCPVDDDEDDKIMGLQLVDNL